MAIPLSRLNPDGSLKAYTQPEINAMLVRPRKIEAGDHPTRVYDPNTNSITATYFVKPESHQEFLCLALGAVKTYFDSGLGYDQLSRIMPLIYPGTDKCICTQAMAKGFRWVETDVTGIVPVPTYWAEEWEVRFETARWDLHDDPPVSERLRYVEVMPRESVSEYLTLPGIGLNFLTPLGDGPHGKVIPYNVGLPFISGRVRYRWKRIPRAAWRPGSALWDRVYGDPENGVLPYLGTVNSTGGIIASGSAGYPPGVLLFENVEEQITFDQVAEDFAYDLIWVWKHIPNGANRLYYPGLSGIDPGWYFAGKGTTYYTPDLLPDGVAIYNARDHRDLFKVG